MYRMEIRVFSLGIAFSTVLRTPPFGCHFGGPGPLEPLLEAPWDPFGAFSAHLLSLFGVSFLGIRFCFAFGLQNGAKIDEFWECLTCAKCGK